MHVDPWILGFSAATVIATIWMGFWSARRSKTASDFFVAGRSVSVGWNSSAISGEYLSAASFMGVAGMVMSSGYDALWYPVCYACGYLFLLLFIAGPLRRFGAYTIPDFAEGRFDSPLFRKIAVVFVLFIGFFYTMPQMKGAGTTLAYIFPGLPYWAGVVLVGGVITLNVALGGMKGITLVQAFQYWLKMFAISVPVFVLMAVYGHYGSQVARNLPPAPPKRQQTLSPLFLTLWWSKQDLGRFTKAVEEHNWPTNGFRWIQDTRVGKNGARPDQVVYTNTRQKLDDLLADLGALTDRTVQRDDYVDGAQLVVVSTNALDQVEFKAFLRSTLPTINIELREQDSAVLAWPVWPPKLGSHLGARLPQKAPSDFVWLNPFGPLTTKAAKAVAVPTNRADVAPHIPLKLGLSSTDHLTVPSEFTNVAQALSIYSDLTGRQLLPRTNGLPERLDDLLGGQLSRWRIVKPTTPPDSGVRYHGDGVFTAEEVKAALDALFKTNGLAAVPAGEKHFRIEPVRSSTQTTVRPVRERPYALLYTYSLIIALVCGTAGLPHILVRFYTNPDGVAAKKTTMWVMILIGVFYLFPPVFGVIGRNLLPDLYAATGAKGTDKVVLEVPRMLNEKIPMLGSILSGITCAGAFAAFMSTFSGLLVSITGALAHDIYGRILHPGSTADQRMRAFKICSVICGAAAIALGFFVEGFEINKLVGWAFAIAATSYFPLLFLSTWWRRITMKGAAAGMLIGGTFSLVAIASTMFADQAKWADGLKQWYGAHPLWRILAEQPAIWALPLAITLMIFISRLTRKEVPADIRMKMLVLHAPEKLGLKQEYIQEHQPGH
jgi:Na+(H+)/acetate symporter ActP